MFRKTIEELAAQPIIGLTPVDTLRSAIQTMYAHHFSCIPVLESGKAVGILTERSITEIIAGSNGTLMDCRLKELMSTPVITATNDTYVYEALHTFVNRNIRHIIMTNNAEESLGIITLSDIVNYIGNQLMVEFHEIEHYMSKTVYSVRKELFLKQAIIEMATRRISCIIVSENNRPIGILTERDVIRLTASGKDPEKIRVAEVMNTPVVQINQSMQVHAVTRMMKSQGIRRVVVVDKNGHMSGLVTQTNIMRGLESSYIKILKQIIKEKESRIEDTILERDKISQYLRTILNSAIDLAIVATDQRFRIIYYNNCAESILNWPADLATGAHIEEIHTQQGIETAVFNSIMAEVQHRGTHSFTYDRQANGETRYFQARISAIGDTSNQDPLGYALLVQDITERKRAEENVRYMAYHDILTGLPNRATFNERLELELTHNDRDKKMLAVVMIDLDNFKPVNDNYGHYTGDLLLAEIAKRLSKSLRKSDTVARIGGDEFIIILPHINIYEDALAVGEKLIEAMAPAIDLNGVEHYVSISLGVALAPEHSTTAKGLVNRADAAMYEAKEAGRKNGRSNICVYHREITEPSPCHQALCSHK